jgi:Helix-turn-helix domain
MVYGFTQERQDDSDLASGRIEVVHRVGARLMRKTFKYRLYPNKETSQKLFWTLTRCRELYNAALSERRDAYKYAGKSISYYDQQNDLPEIKAEIRQRSSL